MLVYRSRRRSLAAVILLLTVFSSNVARAQRTQPAQKKHPRLVLLIVIDQFRYDYLKRFSDLYGPGGFKRLLRSGASWENANYDYLATKTAPGHSAIGTGAPPAATGMVGNEWLEGSPVIKVTSVSDTSARTLGGGVNEGASSPRRLLASTFGDELRLATNDRAKVIGVSDKPRAAILATGRRANGAYWFNSYGGGMASSDYYFPQLPTWVAEFNQTRPADKYYGAKWERLLPEREYLRRAGPDSPPWEDINAKSDTNAFPHTITGGADKPSLTFYDALDHSPFLNELLVAFAEVAIDREQLGQDADTDVLSLSLSANDHVGHRFGPYSQEVMDLALRTDRQIAGLLDFVDAKVGLQNTIVILTADHGVGPTVEHAAALGLGGRRIRHLEIMTKIRAAISRRYNPDQKSPDPTADYMKYGDAGQARDAIINGNIHFNHAALDRDGVNLEEIAKVAGEAALKVPGMARYYTRGQLQSGCAFPDERRPGRTRSNTSTARANMREGNVAASISARCAGLTDPIARMAERAFYPSRSGDLVLIAESFNVLGDTTDGATHGSPYSYDTHVPLIIMGPGIRPGRHLQAASPTDIAPTLATLLGIQPPSNASGRILLEALTTR